MAQAGTAYIEVRGDYSRFNKQLRREAGGFGKRFSGAAKGGAIAAGAALGAGLAVGLKKAVDEAREAAKVTAQTGAVIKSTGGKAGVTAKQIEQLATALSNKSAIDDEAIQKGANLLLTFTNIRNEVGKGNDIFSQATTIITDMSVALDQDMKSSAIQVGKALNDPVKGVTALQRVGVAFTKDQKDQIKTLVESGKTMEAQKLILRELNTEFAGSAQAQADPFDRFKVATDNLAEALGTSLLPTLGKITDKAATFINQLQTGTGTGGAFASGVSDAFNGVKRAISGFVDSLNLSKGDVNSFVSGLVAAFHTIKPVLTSIFKGAKALLQGFARTVGGVVKLISGILHGDFGKMWEGIKQMFSGWLKGLGGIIRASTAVLRHAAAAAAKGVWQGIKAAGTAVYNAGKWLVGKAKDAIMSMPGVRIGRAVINKVVEGMKSVASKLLDVGKWITNQIKKGLGKIVPDIDLPDLNPFGGRGGGNVGPLGGETGNFGLVGSLASKYGNYVTSGYRPGDPGWHGKNRARDYAGGNMRGFASAVAGRFGTRLLELIHTPLGFGIKNGRRVPLSFWGPAVNADHFDHVHVAMRRGGKAGPGEGGPSVVFGEGKKTEWWISQEGDKRKNILWASEALAALTGKRLEMYKFGGRAGASVFNDVKGYRGDNLHRKWDSYAELSNNPGARDFKALGGLPYMAPLDIEGPNGKVLRLYKRDVGAGGGPVNGLKRRIDLTTKAAQKLGVKGLGVVTIGADKAKKGAKSTASSRWARGGSVAGPGASREEFAPRGAWRPPSESGTSPDTPDDGAAQLAAAVAENTKALQEHTKEIQRVSASNQFQIARAITDMISQQLGGRVGGAVAMQAHRPVTA